MSYVSNNVHICAVCRRVLDLCEPAAGEPRYIHTVQDRTLGHEPQPIPAPEDYREGRCDFCNLDHPEFVVPARDFEVLPGHGSRGDWAACKTCVGLIEHNRWTDLVTRVVAIRERFEGRQLVPAEVAALRRLFRKVRQNITGGPKPL